MNIESIIARLNTHKSDTLYKKMGYHSKVNFEKTLQIFKESDTINEWLLSGHYDFTKNAEDFFTTLSKELDFSDNAIQNVLLTFECYKQEKERFKGSYIFVNTNFKRKNEPVFVLAFLEAKRNIPLYDVKELLFKSEEEMLKIVSNLAKKHYLQNNGELQIWGKIENYQVHLDGRVYVLDIEGNLTNGALAVSHSLARVV